MVGITIPPQSSAVASGVFDLRQYVLDTSGATDVTTAVQQWANEAELAKVAGTRVQAILGKGKFKITAITIAAGIDVDFAGGSFVTTTSDITQPLVTIGSTAEGNTGARLVGIDIRHTTRAHGWPSEDAAPNVFANFCGLRILNAQAAYIQYGYLDGFNINLQMYAAGGIGEYTGYTNVFHGQNLNCKICLDHRSAHISNWVNQLNHFGANFAPGSGAAATKGGSMWCVRYSRLPGAYPGQNQINYFGPAFQPGTISNSWSPSKSVVVGDRLYSVGYEYEYTTQGDTDSDPNNFPRHNSTTPVADGTAAARWVGHWRRQPMWFDDAGGEIHVVNGRWESGVGGFCRMNGTFNGINEFHIGSKIAVTAGSSVCDIEDMMYATTHSYRTDTTIIGNQQKGASSVSIDDIHLRAIKGTTTWHVAGLQFRDIFGAITNEVAGDATSVLCADSLYWNGVNKQLGCFVDTRHIKRFLVERDSFDDGGRIAWAPMTDQFTVMDWEDAGALKPAADWAASTAYTRGTRLQHFGKEYKVEQSGTSDTTVGPSHIAGTVDNGTTKLRYLGPYSSVLIAVNFGSLVSGTDTGRTGTDIHSAVPLAIHPAVDYTWIGFLSLQMKGFRISHLQDTLRISAEQPVSCLLKGATFADTQRYSAGAPTEGIFLQKGEFIRNAELAVGQPKGWYVTTVGALAQAFAASTTVIKKQLVLGTGNRIYKANILSGGLSATCGTVAPSGTSANISDGSTTVSWDYFSDLAVLTADENLA